MINFFLRAVLIFTVIFPSETFTKVEAQEINAGSLQECWKFQSDQTANLKIASDNANELYYSTKGNIEAVKISEGKILWKTELGGEVVSNILYEKEKIYVVTRSEPKKTKEEIGQSKEVVKTDEIIIRSISSLTGLTFWKQTLEVSKIDQIDLISTNNRLNVVLSFGKVVILDQTTGQIYSQITTESSFSSKPFIYNQNIYIGNTKNEVQYLTDGKSKNIEELNLKNIPRVVYVNSDNGTDYLFVGDELGTVYCFNLNTKKTLWKMRTGAEIIGIKENDGHLFVSSNDNFVYSISQATGNIIWKKRLAGRSEFIISSDKTLIILATVNSDTLTISKSDKGNTINQFFLRDEDYFVSSPILINEFFIIPTNSGFSVFSLMACGEKYNSKN